MEKDWKLVFETASLQKAELIKAILEENGIRAVSINKKDSSYAFGEIEVYVQSADFLKANHLVKSYNSNQ